MKFEFMEHSADIKFKAYGNNFEDLLSNCLLAFKKSLTDDDVLDEVKKTFKFSANDKERLLYNFMEELIFLFDSENLIASRINKIDFSGDWVLCSVFFGRCEKYKFKTSIKAVTYSDMKIFNDKNGFVAVVTLDV